VFDIGPEKLLLVLVIALIFLGPQKLPEIARSLGRGLREIRQAGQAARDELMDGLDTEATPPILTGPVAKDEERADASASNGSAGTSGSAEERPDPERTGRSG
jgi:sec-independent protein translocase protein TatA